MGISVGGGSGGQGSMTYASNLDHRLLLWVHAKIEDYDYKLIGLKPMLACVHGARAEYSGQILRAR